MPDAPRKRIKVYVLQSADRANFRGEWVDPGTGSRLSRSLKTSDPGEAETRRADLEYRLNHGLPIDPPKAKAATTWEDFRARHSEERLAAQRESSRAKAEAVLDVLEEVVSPKKLADVDADAMRRFLQHMERRKGRGGKAGLAPHTRHSYLVAVSAALRWAAEVGMIAAAPKPPRVKVPRRRPMPVPPEDVERMLAAADGPWRVYLLLALWAGLRRWEAYQVRWAAHDHFPWLDMAGKRVWVPCTFAKGDEDQWVPLHPAIYDALLVLPRDHGDRVFVFTGRVKGSGELFPTGLSHAIQRVAAKAGVKLSMQKLRRAFGCRLASRVPAPVLQRLMRHASITTTMAYYATAEDASLREAIESL